MSRVVARWLVVFAVLLLVPTIAAGAPKVAKRTHLGADVGALVNLRTFNVPNNNTGGHLLYYDRDGDSPFSVPEGYSFVVTDVMVHLSSLDANNNYLVVVNFTDNGARSFAPSFSGRTMQHYPLAGGAVVPGGHTPTVRNTTFSSSAIEIQLLGYFVKGSGPEPGVPVF